MEHFGLVGLQISLPKKDKAIPTSFQICFGSRLINSLSIFIPSLVSLVKPNLGATLMTCKSTIIPSA